MSEHSHNPVTQLLLQAVRWICQPLVKLLIDKGITYPVFCDLMKSIYVDSAQKRLKSNEVEPSLSRIFIKTGINRKEVKRILEQLLLQDDTSSQTPSLGGLLVSRWMGLPEYTTKDGTPRKLVRVSSKGEAGFNDLVESINKDVHPRALLDEWIELGVVTIDAEDRVCLNERAFTPKSSFEEKVFFFGKNVRDHIETCVHNLIIEDPSKLERSIYYSSLSETSVRKLQKLANDRTNETIQLLNKEALSLKSIDMNDKDNSNPKYRIRYGCYWFDDSNTPESKK